MMALTADDTIAWYANDGAKDPTWTLIQIATNTKMVKMNLLEI